MWVQFPSFALEIVAVTISARYEDFYMPKSNRYNSAETDVALYMLVKVQPISNMGI